PITGGSATDYDVSPDGKEICFTSESAKELGMDFNADLYVMPTEASRERKRPEEQPRNITTDNPANDFAPVYSPDGKRIAFSRQTTKYFYADRSRIMIHVRSSGKNVELTGKLDRSCSAPFWFPDGLFGGIIFFEVEDKGEVQL